MYRIFTMVCVREYFFSLYFILYFIKENIKLFAVDMFFFFLSVLSLVCVCVEPIDIFQYWYSLCVYIDDALHFIKIAREVLFIFIHLALSLCLSHSHTQFYTFQFSHLWDLFVVNKWMRQIYINRTKNKNKEENILITWKQRKAKGRVRIRIEESSMPNNSIRSKSVQYCAI